MTKPGPWIRWLGWICLGVTLALLVCQATSYEIGLHDGESVRRFSGHAIKNGTHVRPGDIVNAFNTIYWDADRPRFLDYLAHIWTVKFRLWVWNWMPPYPAMTPWWLFTLVLGSLLFFSAAQSLYRSRTAALFVTSIFLSSTGFLYSSVYLFRQGKPLVSFLLVLLLAIVLKIDWKSPLHWGSNMLLSIVLVIANLLDETGAFLCVVYSIFVLAFIPFLKWQFYLRAAVPPLMGVLGLLGSAFWLSPYMAWKYHGREFRFMARLGEGTPFSLEFVWKTLVHLCSAAVLPLRELGFTRSPIPDPAGMPVLPWIFGGPGYLYAGLGILFIIAILTWKMVGRTPSQRNRGLTLITIFILYILFQSFVLSRHESEIIVAYGFHVGALFSVFFSLMLGCFLLKSFNSPKASRRGAAAAVAIWIIAVQSHNFEYILEGWRMHSATKTDCQFFPRVHVKYVAPKFILPEGSAYASESGGSERSTRERVFEAWQKWREHPLELPDFGSEPIHCREMWAVEELAHKHKEAVYDLTGVSLFWRWPAD